MSAVLGAADLERAVTALEQYAAAVCELGDALAETVNQVSLFVAALDHFHYPRTGARGRRVGPWRALPKRERRQVERATVAARKAAKVEHRARQRALLEP